MSADKNLYRVWPDGMERFEAMALVRQDVLKREETARKAAAKAENAKAAP